MIVTCYLDESATDGGTPQAVVGGLQMNESHFLGFDPAWRSMLHELGLEPVLHMKDFGRHGRFSDKSPDDRRLIFERAVTLINKHKIYSFAATLEASQYKAIIGGTLRGNFSIYGMCFVGTVLGNHLFAEQNGYLQDIPFLLDAGNPNAEHVRLAHVGLLELQATGQHPLNLGGLTFDDDRRVTPLQAADVVCWAVRRKATGYPFNDGYEPLLGILNDPAHSELPLPIDVMRGLNEEIERQAESGTTAV